MHQASRSRTASLEAGASVENNHQIAAQGCSLFGLADAKPFTRGSHQDDRDYSPGYPEHGQKGTHAVRPESSKHVLDKIKK